jgi:hypothetical protein
MKRFFWSMMSVGVVAVVAGCPIYSDNSSYRVCDESACYACPNEYYDDNCSSWQCNSSNDCPSGYSCGSDASGNPTCVIGTSPDSGVSGGCTQQSDCPNGEVCGSDGTCQDGDCSTAGCPSGYVCKLSDGTASCVSLGGIDGGTPDSSMGDSSVDGGDTAPSGCQSAADCTSAGAGAQCLNGVCTPASGQCFDQTQCPANSQCVQGACTPSCSSASCPTGYSCDANNECTGNPTPCGSGTTCTSGDVCVEQHCVLPCGDGGTCATAGFVCVEGGCIPNQLPTFVCGADGSIGDGQAGDCAIGSICLHHSCFIACNPDAGATACAEAAMFNVCKSVTTSSGTYPVCGSSSNLGSQCDPTQNEDCPSSGVCIDGYCH